jgi:hypothetical protein
LVGTVQNLVPLAKQRIDVLVEFISLIKPNEIPDVRFQKKQGNDMECFENRVGTT